MDEIVHIHDILLQKLDIENTHTRTRTCTCSISSAPTGINGEIQIIFGTVRTVVQKIQ